VRQRDDKRPEECVGEGALPHGDEPEPGAAPEPQPRSQQPPFTPSHPEKVFWPEEGLTKGDLLAYYRTAARWLLPYLRDRPVVLDRWPDGIGGKSFFQKNAPPSVPEWVRTEAVYSEGSGQETRCFVCDDEETLLYLVNLGTLPLHVWASRFAALQTPDWSILDLDAKQATFAQVVEVARALRRLTRGLGLPSFVKTSGATGLHVLIPLGGRCTFEQARQLAELLARVVVDRMPAAASLARNPELRRGKVYVDCLQNGWGKLLAAPYAVRPLPGAPVSMPLSWREVRAGLDPKKFTLQTAPRRLARWKGDPLREVLTARPDLVAALARLAEWV
jgi:bifunctional non-homologous end joining protein LigD